MNYQSSKILLSSGKRSDLRANIDPLWVTMIGHLRVTIGYLRATVGHLRLSMGHTWVTIDYLRALK